MKSTIKRNQSKNFPYSNKDDSVFFINKMKNILIEKIIQILIYVKQRFLMLHRKGIKGKKK